jgi:release factor glutamine methyltransferase
LSCYRKILPSVSDILGSEGVAIFEVGAGQQEDVRRIAELSGLQIRDEFKDLSGHTRCLILEPTNF